MGNCTIPDLFCSQVKLLGQKIALREKTLGIWKEISWDKYYEHVNFFALGLISLEVKKGDRIAILGENCLEWLYADLGIQCVGGVRVGIYPTCPAFEVEYHLRHSGAVLCVTEDQEQVDKVLEVKDNCPDLKYIVFIDSKGLTTYKFPILKSFDEVQKLGRMLDRKKQGLLQQYIEGISENDVSIMVYTSGTTGPPKGAMLSHRSLIYSVRILNQEIKLRQGDNVISYLPLCHAAESIFSLFFPMIVGTVTNFAESINTVQEALVEIPPRFFLGVPRIFEKLHSSTVIKMQRSNILKKSCFNLAIKIGEKIAEKIWAQEKLTPMWKLLYFFAYLVCFRSLKEKFGLLNAEIVLSGTAPISEEILKFFHSLGIYIQQGYGQTENCGFTFLQRRGSYTIGSVGTPMPGIEYKLAEDGEILIKSEQNFLGYFKDPETTAKTIVNDWVYTGDLGRLDEEGNLFIVGRKKDIIITAGGKNISPSQIENQLKGSPYIKEVIVIGDKRKFISALIAIDYEITGEWATNNHLTYTTLKDLATNQKVYELIQEEVNKCNELFARVENVRKFRLLQKELDVEDEEVTATLKTKRESIIRRYAELINGMYL